VSIGKYGNVQSVKQRDSNSNERSHTIMNDSPRKFKMPSIQKGLQKVTLDQILWNGDKESSEMNRDLKMNPNIYSSILHHASQELGTQASGIGPLNDSQIHFGKKKQMVGKTPQTMIPPNSNR